MYCDILLYHSPHPALSSFTCPRIMSSNCLTGFVYIMRSDPKHPRLAGRVFVGGSIRKGSAVKVSTSAPETILVLVRQGFGTCWLRRVLPLAMRP